MSNRIFIARGDDYQQNIYFSRDMQEEEHPSVWYTRKSLKSFYRCKITCPAYRHGLYNLFFSNSTPRDGIQLSTVFNDTLTLDNNSLMFPYASGHDHTLPVGTLADMPPFSLTKIDYARPIVIHNRLEEFLLNKATQQMYDDGANFKRDRRRVLPEFAGPHIFSYNQFDIALKRMELELQKRYLDGFALALHEHLYHAQHMPPHHNPTRALTIVPTAIPSSSVEAVVRNIIFKMAPRVDLSYMCGGKRKREGVDEDEVGTTSKNI
ncbi:hypothetical protein BDZ89DRAFT_1045570 [Hymenopellis radicata]|nr:hypothetical protein BDZ89DRAFT_1045570 [Hymenopellis radicata]